MKDTIYRDDAIEAINKFFDKETFLKSFVRKIAIDAIIQVPSASRPQGEWKLDLNGMDWNIPAWRCSKCGFVASYIGVQTDGLGNNPMNWAGSKYCPNCGARMKGADDDSI